MSYENENTPIDVESLWKYALIKVADPEPWSDEHQDYWSKVSKICKLLAAQLEFSVHGYRDRPYFYSTIAVSDFKEKFGLIRIYCSFADPYLVKQKYEDYVNTINRSNLDYRSYKNGEEVPNWKRRVYEENPQDYPKDIPIDLEWNYNENID